MPDTAAIAFADVCFAYDREEVLHNVSFSIGDGDLVGMVGPNGGGKSTLIKLALGLLSPGRGQVRVFGRAPTVSREQIGYVPQHLQFDPAFPVSTLDVVLMGRAERHWIGPYRWTDRDAAMAALDTVKLTDSAKHGFPKLSGGQRQRALIAQALVSEPKILLLDEPTANVDSAVAHDIYELLHELNRQITIVVVSHNLNVVTRYATHVVCVNRTASILPMSEITDANLHAVMRGDLAVLQHEQSCHILDPTAALEKPHRSGSEDDA